MKPYRPLYITPIALLLSLALGPLALANCENEDSPTDQSIVFAIDVSGSVDADEMRLQMGAYKHALNNQEVRDRLLGCGCTDLAVVLFGTQSRVVLDPTKLISETDIDQIVSFLSGLKSNPTPLSDVYNVGGQTSVVNGLKMSIDTLLRPENTSSRNVILISGDGVNSTFAENELNALKEVVRSQVIEVHAIPIESGNRHDLFSFYNDGDFAPMFPGEVMPGMPNLPSMDATPNGIRYESLEAFYKEFVISEYGRVHSAKGFHDLKPVMTESVKELACQLIM